jgi:hypothetical protein
MVISLVYIETTAWALSKQHHAKYN